MGKPDIEKFEETNGQIGSDTKCNSKEQVSISFEEVFFFLGMFSSPT